MATRRQQEALKTLEFQKPKTPRITPIPYKWYQSQRSSARKAEIMTKKQDEMMKPNEELRKHVDETVGSMQGSLAYVQSTHAQLTLQVSKLSKEKVMLDEKQSVNGKGPKQQATPEMGARGSGVSTIHGNQSHIKPPPTSSFLMVILSTPLLIFPSHFHSTTSPIKGISLKLIFQDPMELMLRIGFAIVISTF